MRIKNKTPAKCGQLVAPELSAWLRELRTAMMNTAKAAIRKAKTKECFTTLPLTKWGLKLLKESRWKWCYTHISVTGSALFNATRSHHA